MNADKHSSDSISTCRLCGQFIYRFLSDIRGYDLERCPSCGFVQVAQKPSQEELEHIYQDTYFNHSKYRDQDTLQIENFRRLKFLNEAVGKGSQVLEVGCGEGSFIKLAKAEYKVSGFDLSATGINIAKEQNPEISDRIWVGSVEGQSNLQGQFNVICLWDVLEHIWDPLPVCQELLEWLKPGGFILISTPNINTLTAAIFRKHWAFMTPPEHLSFFSPRSIQYLFEDQLNAKVIKKQSMGKKVNLGFLLYKLRRVFPRLPGVFLSIVEGSVILSKISLYLPTGDIQYITVQKG